jgi:RHS repeat-associated protein
MIRIANSEPTSLFAFTGRAPDKEAAVEPNLLRHFDPAVGRWLDDEPVGHAAGDANQHRYADNRPQ